MQSPVDRWRRVESQSVLPEEEEEEEEAKSIGRVVRFVSAPVSVDPGVWADFGKHPLAADSDHRAGADCCVL